MGDFKDKDDFWNLDDMLPPQKNKPQTSRKFDTEATDFIVAAQGEQNNAAQKLDFASWLENRDKARPQKSESVSIYHPKNPLIKSVTIRKPTGRRTSVERFLVNGRLLFNEVGEFTENVPFYSVYPQYALMSEEQKRCYIGFRSAVRGGVFPAVDEAYIYLYLYEIINLVDLMTPTERADKIAALICGYAECTDRLFSDMCNWLADICLIHELELPQQIYGDVHPRVLKRARFEEFFLKYNASRSDRELYRLMSASGKYDYRSSKYYKENAYYYDKYIESAVCYALSVIAKTEKRFEPNENNILRLTNESFFGAYRTLDASYTVTVECAALTRSDEERRTVTELIKYAENCLRAHLGIKQKLTVSYLSREKKELVKQYFAVNATELRNVQKSHSSAPAKRQIPDYERLYEPKNEGFTLQNAELIEKSSWAVTEKLVTAFEGEDVDDGVDGGDTPLDADNTPSIASVNGEKRIIIDALGAIYEDDMPQFKSIARQCGVMEMALVDEINNFLLDEIGDVGIEVTDSGFAVAAWYRDDIAEILGGK